ncbi:hypothetical protein B0H94_106151 [Salsuginibacillus halophilus]|uniref:Uncharacterized protein n=1 Tax=Salsuginibacillus halophilus TaxID=517424 RepID=A0A2P8HI47_9BACI|nr:DUF5327 family protein [Salsuginibacillus halophilus]PSL45896.1 hypothetical protein B0H94_106151 [Salsuginibacillus halophilus]
MEIPAARVVDYMKRELASLEQAVQVSDDQTAREKAKQLQLYCELLQEEAPQQQIQPSQFQPAPQPPVQSQPAPAPQRAEVPKAEGNLLEF